MAAFGGRCVLQIAREIRDFLLELRERAEGIHLEHRHEAAVIMPTRGFHAKAKPSQQAAENFHHRRQAKTLIAFRATKRQQSAALLQLRRIARGFAICANHPTIRHFLPARLRQKHLAGSSGRGCHIQHKWPGQIRRHRNGNRVGTKPRFTPTERRHRLGGPPGIRRANANHASFSRHEWIARQTPDMPLPKHGGCRDIGCLRFFDGVAHGLFVGDVSKTPMTINHRCGGAFLHNFPWRAGHNMPNLDSFDIARDHNDPMRIMAHQIGAGAMPRDGFRLICWRASSD